MQSQEQILNQRGVGLIEAMIALVVVGGMLWAMIDAVLAMHRAEVRMNTMGTLRELKELAKEAVQRSSSCGIPEISAGGLPVKDPSWDSKSRISVSTNGIQSPLLTLKGGDTYDGQLRIDSIEIGPFYDKIKQEEKYLAIDRPDPNDVANALKIRGEVRLQVHSERGISVPLAPIQIPAQFQLSDDRSRIISCDMMATGTDSPESRCLGVGGIWDESRVACEMPCPTGTVDRGGECVPAQSGNSKNVVFHCQSTNSCGVPAKFISP